MSGGVDSSVAALLLKRQGYDVTGVFMRCYSAEGGSPPDGRAGASGGNLPGCTTEQDAEDARRVAGKLKIPFYVWDFEKEYKKYVVEYMVDGYRSGITPNPDVMCNREIKFGLFLERALAAGADYIATGHYVRLRRTRSIEISKYRYSLSAARDKNKDQSYFLWTLTQGQLQHCLFPIGDYLKSEVRTIARRAGLPTADKRDSQGICFLGKFSFKEFLKKRIRVRRGNIVTVAGTKVGEHDGAAFYTIGQRHIGVADRGLSRTLRGTARKDFKPFYVAEKDMKRNTLVVAEGEHNPALHKKELVLADVNWIHHSSLTTRHSKLFVYARVRYRQLLAPATLTIADRTLTDAERSPHKSALRPRGSALLVFTQRQRAVAPGQSAVFYSKKGEMLGGGVITAAH
jgi:tRNA-specific 2-thiouridylase